MDYMKIIYNSLSQNVQRKEKEESKKESKSSTEQNAKDLNSNNADAKADKLYGNALSLSSTENKMEENSFEGVKNLTLKNILNSISKNVTIQKDEVATKIVSKDEAAKGWDVRHLVEEPIPTPTEPDPEWSPLPNPTPIPTPVEPDPTIVIGPDPEPMKLADIVIKDADQPLGFSFDQDTVQTILVISPDGKWQNFQVSIPANTNVTLVQDKYGQITFTGNNLKILDINNADNNVVVKGNNNKIDLAGGEDILVARGENNIIKNVEDLTMGVLQVAPGEKGSAEWASKLLGENFAEIQNAQYDDQGRLVSFEVPKYLYFNDITIDNTIGRAGKVQYSTEVVTIDYNSYGDTVINSTEYGNKGGKFEKSSRFDENDNFKYSNAWGYDEAGNYTRYEYVDASGCRNVCDYAYNENNMLVSGIEETYQNGELTSSRQQSYKYDEKGNPTYYESAYFDANGKQTYRTISEYSYGENGNQIASAWTDFYEDGSISKGRTEFNENGSVSYNINTQYDANGTRTRNVENKYDENGNFVSTVAEVLVNPGDSTWENGMRMINNNDGPAMVSYTIDKDGHMELNASGFDIKAEQLIYYTNNDVVPMVGEDDITTLDKADLDVNTNENVLVSDEKITISRRYYSSLTNITINGDNNNITGGAGDDKISVKGNNNLVDLGKGDDTLNIVGNNNKIKNVETVTMNQTQPLAPTPKVVKITDDLEIKDMAISVGAGETIVVEFDRGGWKETFQITGTGEKDSKFMMFNSETDSGERVLVVGNNIEVKDLDNNDDKVYLIGDNISFDGAAGNDDILVNIANGGVINLGDGEDKIDVSTEYGLVSQDTNIGLNKGETKTVFVETEAGFAYVQMHATEDSSECIIIPNGDSIDIVSSGSVDSFCVGLGADVRTNFISPTNASLNMKAGEEKSFAISGQNFYVRAEEDGFVNFTLKEDGAIAVTANNISLEDLDNDDDNIIVYGDNVIVNTAGGNDNVTVVSQGEVIIYAGDGDDNVNVQGRNVLVDAGDGDASVAVNAFETAVVQAGDGNVSVSAVASDAAIYTGNGVNNIDVFANNAVVDTLDGDKYINIEAENAFVNTGTFGNDNVNVVAYNNAEIHTGNDDDNISAKGVDVYVDSANGNKNIQTIASETSIVKTGDGDSYISSSGKAAGVYTGNGNHQIFVDGYDAAEVKTADGDNFIYAKANDVNVKTGDNGNDTVNAMATNNALVNTGDGDDNVFASGKNVGVNTGYGNHEIVVEAENIAEVRTLDGDNNISAKANDVRVITGNDGNDYVNVVANNSSMIGLGNGGDVLNVAGNNINVLKDYGYFNMNFYGDNAKVVSNAEANDIKTLDYMVGQNAFADQMMSQLAPTVVTKKQDEKFNKDGSITTTTTTYTDTYINGANGNLDIYLQNAKAYNNINITASKDAKVNLVSGSDSANNVEVRDGYVIQDVTVDSWTAYPVNEDIIVDDGDNKIYVGDGEDIIVAKDGDNKIYVGDGDDIIKVDGGSSLIEKLKKSENKVADNTLDLKLGPQLNGPDTAQ